MQRRSFIAAILGAAAAPAIVKAESLMKLWVPEKTVWHTGGIVSADGWQHFEIERLARKMMLNDSYGRLSETYAMSSYSSARVALEHDMLRIKTIQQKAAEIQRQIFDQFISTARPAWPADGLS